MRTDTPVWLRRLSPHRLAAFDDPASQQRHASYLARGRYAEQLERLFEHYPRERVLVLFSEDLFRNAQVTVDRAFEFLGLSSASIGSVRARNVGEYDREAIPLEATLRRWFRPHDARLETVLGTRLPWVQ